MSRERKYYLDKSLTIPGENWKDIEGYEGLYQASDLGRVKSLQRVVERNGKESLPIKESILSQKIDQGYLRVSLTNKNKERQMHSVGRLVGKCFVSNPKNLPEINHKFGDKLDNRANQLEWTDRVGNQVHAYNAGLRRKKITREIALKIRVSYPKIKTPTLSKMYGLSTGTISSIIRKKIWKDG